MSYRVLSNHKACLSLVRHGWLVPLLLGRRISFARATSPLISPRALETSGEISIDEASSINGTSATCSTPLWKIISAISFFYEQPLVCSIPASRQDGVSDGERCRNGKLVPCTVENRLRANQSRLDLSIQTPRPIVWERGRGLRWCRTHQRRHVPLFGWKF